MMKRHHQYFIVSVLSLIAAVWIYYAGRNGFTKYELWLGISKTPAVMPMAGWLPDYLWSLSLLFAVAGTWKGWAKVPLAWKWLLWAAITLTEPLQLWGVLEGTADILDVLAYQGSFITISCFDLLHQQYTLSHEKN